jgi:flagellar hook assembly protein FlgD
VIPFDLVESTTVELAVYDLLGQRVALIQDAVLPAGHHEIIWNGRNSSGDQVASGVYFVQLRTAEFVATRKMVKIK